MLRAVTADSAIEAASTLDELSAVWPEVFFDHHLLRIGIPQRGCKKIDNFQASHRGEVAGVVIERLLGGPNRTNVV